jgi:lipoate-protein ligase B
MEPSGEHLPDVLLVLEHQPVYTLGTGANEEYVSPLVLYPILCVFAHYVTKVYQV